MHGVWANAWEGFILCKKHTFLLRICNPWQWGFCPRFTISNGMHLSQQSNLTCPCDSLAQWCLQLFMIPTQWQTHNQNDIHMLLTSGRLGHSSYYDPKAIQLTVAPTRKNHSEHQINFTNILIRNRRTAPAYVFSKVQKESKTDQQ